MKYLYLNNISFDKENKIKINLNNLKYLDLRIKEQDGYEEDCEFDNSNNKAGFYKEHTLENLINIFDFEFLSIFKIAPKELKNDQKKEEEDEDMEKDDDEDDDEDMEDDDDDAMENYEEFEIAFKKPQELFDKKYLYKYDYFNFEVLYEYFRISGAAEFAGRFIYKYLFSKTKGNKYLFKTEFTNYENSNGEFFETINKDVRYCNNINYEDYYFINNESEIGGDNFIEESIDYEKINSISIVSKYDTYSYGLMKIFEKFKNNKNKLEIISIEDLNLDLIKLNSFLKDLKKFKNLKCFYITKECIFKNNKQFIDLLTGLSNLNSLFLVEIVIKGVLKLSKEEEKKINKIFPNILIKKEKKETLIKWNNENFELKINN